MPSYKDKSEIRVKLDIMESRALVDGAVLREIRSRILSMSAAHSQAPNLDRSLHASHRIKILTIELESVIGVQQINTAQHDATSLEQTLENIEGRLGAIVSYLRNSQADTDQIIRDIMSTPTHSPSVGASPFFSDDMRTKDSPTLPPVIDSRRIPEVSSTNDIPALASATAEVLDMDSRFSRSLSPTGKTPWTPEIERKLRGTKRLPRPLAAGPTSGTRQIPLDGEGERSRGQRSIARLFSSTADPAARPAPLSRGRTLRRG